MIVGSKGVVRQCHTHFTYQYHTWFKSVRHGSTSFDDWLIIGQGILSVEWVVRNERFAPKVKNRHIVVFPCGIWCVAVGYAVCYILLIPWVNSIQRTCRIGCQARLCVVEFPWLFTVFTPMTGWHKRGGGEQSVNVLGLHVSCAYVDRINLSPISAEVRICYSRICIFPENRFSHICVCTEQGKR